ncbi:hypothetical protein UNDYM_1624 [Undibacterium sp. YM2]|uniref:Lcl C-terminal domain-containing protein n=1 Tax=Undibacterium sp. YM2 TaxID=2058625 RepID=UPI001331DBD1|nr:DUF1566 domain-containing protein [Undibacterium sp. YM2]BBB65877.1 hypothetical protein UNDYM_1624 [Undibacterium sp. YM2]
MDTAVKPTPTVSGTPYAGGFYAGRINIEGEQYAIIVAPKAAGEVEAAWHKDVAAANSLSFFDGLANTKAMAEAGSEQAQRMLSMSIYGLSDWYLPSRDELELCYRNLKPTNEQNYCWRGDNPSSVPPGYAYSRNEPAQTTDSAFITGGAEAFEPEWYWTSTQNAGDPSYAWMQSFDGGDQYGYHKSYEYRARAVRRVLIIE